MEMKPLFAISYELIFQIINTLLVFAILILIVYGICKLSSKRKSNNKDKNKIAELEKKVQELEDKIENINKCR